MKSMLTKKNLLSSLLYLCLITWGITEASKGYLQFYAFCISNNSPYQITGSFYNSGPYAGFLSTILPMAVYITLNCSEKNKWFKQIISFFAWTSIFLILTILPATMSRAAWLAASTGTGIILILHYHIISRIRRYMLVHWKQAFLYLVIFCFLFAAIGTYIYYLKKDSADGRLLMWKVTTQIIAKNPLTGVGLGKFVGAYGQAQAEYFAQGKASPQEKYVAGSPEYAFNEFLHITAETGIIGLILFLLILIMAFFSAYKNRQIGVIGSLTAFLTFACFSYPFSVWQLNLFFIFLLAIAFMPQVYEKQKMVDNKWKVCVTGIILVLAFPFLIRATKQWQTKQQVIELWRKEQGYYNMEIYKETIDNYRKLYPLLRNEAKFLFEFGQSLAKTELFEESNRILREGANQSSDPMFWNIMGKNYQAMHHYQEAEECFIHAYNMVPNRLYPLYLLANLYFFSGQNEKGINMAQRIIDKDPKVMSSAVQEMKTEMREKLTELQSKIN